MEIRRILVAVVCVLALGLSLQFAGRKLSQHGSISGSTRPLAQPIPAYTRSLRPNYPYSVIPGGAYSGAELRYADQEDSVVKEHYADFNVKKAQMVELTSDKFQYVSYRLKKKIYWTKKKLRIPKGEVLLTDGASFARARCGNRLSEDPHRQVSDQEPPEKALAFPMMQPGSPMELAEAPPLGELAAITPVDLPRLQPVFPTPPAAASPPPEFPPVFPIAPPIFVPPAIFPPGVTPPGTPPVPPGNPPLVPPSVVPPPDSPPVSTVPEPKAVYLFVVTFIVSLYGLTRMMPEAESGDKPGAIVK